MLIRTIEKLESYSLKKQFWILFFIATWDIWVMPILTMCIYLLGLDDLPLLQITYKTVFNNRVGCEICTPKLITEYSYYYIYIYI